jgi:biotin carboxyl carrier protein
MPGLIEINVVVGQTVKKMILIDPEAMKMENSFLSPRWVIKSMLLVKEML